MKVKEIIAFACSFIGEQEIVKKLTSTEAVSLTDKEQEKVDTLVRCFNLVNQEIASDYLPFLYTAEKSSFLLSISFFSIIYLIYTA